jgi:diguanylate cyclase (GGDEF)-like protein
MLVFDLDEFKKVNDRYGHPIGDQVLQIFARAVGGQVRSSDLVGRIGGEEFAALLLNCDRLQALDVAERIRIAFADMARVLDTLPVAATVSVGVAVLAPGQEFLALLAAADQAVYRAKSDGRNCVRTVEDGGVNNSSLLPPRTKSDAALAA